MSYYAVEYEEVSLFDIFNNNDDKLFAACDDYMSRWVRLK